MADRIAIDRSSGRLYRWNEEDQRWDIFRDVSEDVGPVESALIGAGRRMAGVGAGAANLASQLLMGDTAPELTAEVQGDIAAEEAERDRLMAPLEEGRPVSQFVGQMLPEALGAVGLPARLGTELALGATSGALTYNEDPARQLLEGASLGMLGAGAGYGVGRMADRVAGRILRQADEAAPPAPRAEPGAEPGGAEFVTPEGRAMERAGTLPEPSPEAQAGSVGARRATGAAVEGEEDLVPMGRIESDVRGVQDVRSEAMEAAADAQGLIGAGRSIRSMRAAMTPARQQAAAIGDEVGWTFERADFNEALGDLRESARSFPLTREAFTANQARNEALLRSNVARAVGLPDRVDLGPEAIGTAEARITANLERVEAGIGKVNTRAIAAEAQRVLERGRRGIDRTSEGLHMAQALKEQVEALGDDVRGSDITAWRSQLNDAYRRATADTARPDQFGAENLMALQDALDRAILEAAPQQAPLYRQARAQWRLLKALKRGRSINRDGSINVASFDRALENMYRREYRAGRDAALPEPQRTALRTMRVARTFAPTLGNSGTATRMSLQNIMREPGLHATMLLASRPLGALIGAASRTAPLESGPARAVSRAIDASQ